jgi:hypothetical protein
MKGYQSLLPVLCFILAFFCLTTSSAAVCADYDHYFHPLDACSLTNFARDMVKSGSLLYITGEQPELIILDISNPGDIRQVGNRYLENPVRDLAVKGSVAFLLIQYDILQLVDISVPEEPVLLGACEIGAHQTSIALAGTCAYITTWDHGITIVNIGDPHAPEVIGQVNVGYYPHEIVVDGDYAYVVDYASLYVLDIKNQQLPELIANCPVPGDTRHLALSGDYAYVISCAEEWPPVGNGLYIINISDPTDPWIEGELTTGEQIPAGNLTIWGNNAIIGHGSGFAFIDISDSAAPSYLWQADFAGPPNCLYAQDDILWTLNSRIVNSMELNRDFTPPPVAEIANSENIYCLRTRGDFAYGVDPTSNTLRVFDMSDPENPLLAGSEVMGFSSAYGIALTTESAKTQFAFVGGTNDGEGVNIVDISEPTAPSLLTTIPLPYDHGGFDIEGNYLYIPAQYGEVEIYDISNPFVPILVDSLEFIYSVRFVEVVDDRMYIGRLSTNQTRMWIYDVSDPHNAAYLGESSLPLKPYEFVIREPYIYVADNGGGLLILDVSDPTYILEASRTLTARHAQSLALVDDYVYLADHRENGGIQVMDVSDPYNPQVIGFCQASWLLELVAINGSLLCGCMHNPAVVLPLFCEISAADDGWVVTPEPVTMRVLGNPLPGAAQLSLALNRPLSAAISIHDIQGRLIRRLYEGPLAAGQHNVVWNGMDHSGIPMAAGTYFARLRYDENEVSRRLILIR